MFPNKVVSFFCLALLPGSVSRPVAGVFQGISRGVRVHLSDEKRLASGGGRQEKALLIKRQFGSL